MFSEFNFFHLLAVVAVCICIGASVNIYCEKEENIAKINAGWIKKDYLWVPPENVKHEIDKTSK